MGRDWIEVPGSRGHGNPPAEAGDDHTSREQYRTLQYAVRNTGRVHPEAPTDRVDPFDNPQSCMAKGYRRSPRPSTNGCVRGRYNLGVTPSDENFEPDTEGRCELCGRRVGENRLTRHHLLPRSHARRMKRRRKGRQELKRRNPAQTVALCTPCHRKVHASLPNRDLGRGYDSLEALSVHPAISRFVEWVRGKPHGLA